MAGYYYGQLSKEKKAVYDMLAAGCDALAAVIRVPDLGTEVLSDIYLRMKLDLPLLFFVTGFHYRKMPGADHVEVLPDYLFDRGKVKMHRQAVTARLERLARRQYRALAQELGVSRQEVLRAEAQIRALDPRPGAAFAPREEPVYLVPDLVVLQGERGLEVHLQESRLPGLRLSRFYCDMYRDDPDPEVRQYLDGKIRQAQWAIQAVEQRRATLLRCAQVLVRRQEAFFQSPGGSLTSLRLADVAAELSIHESTVSRAVREKYLQCARGVYPLSFFFPREVGAGEGQSAHEIKNQLLQLIREEDKSRPCSDQKLCQLLAEAGYAVSRRTVAKYREELGVSSAVGRRA